MVHAETLRVVQERERSKTSALILKTISELVWVHPPQKEGGEASPSIRDLGPIAGSSTKNKMGG